MASFRLLDYFETHGHMPPQSAYLPAGHRSGTGSSTESGDSDTEGVDRDSAPLQALCDVALSQEVDKPNATEALDS